MLSPISGRRQVRYHECMCAKTVLESDPILIKFGPSCCVQVMVTWPLYYSQFFTFNADLKWKSFHCYFIPFNYTTTKFYTCHDSTVVMSCVKFCSDHCIKHGSKMEIPSNLKIMTGKITCEMGHWQCWHKGVSLLTESMKPSEIMTQNQWLFKTLSGTIDKFHYSSSREMFRYTFLISNEFWLWENCWVCACQHQGALFIKEFYIMIKIWLKIRLL